MFKPKATEIKMILNLIPTSSESEFKLTSAMGLSFFLLFIAPIFKKKAKRLGEYFFLLYLIVISKKSSKVNDKRTGTYNVFS